MINVQPFRRQGRVFRHLDAMRHAQRIVSHRWSLGDGLSRVRVLKLIKVPADGDLLHQLCIDNVSAFQVFT